MDIYNGYGNLSRYYDKLTRDVDYKHMADFTMEACSKFSEQAPKVLVDLACGTGSFLVEIAGYLQEGVGIDVSDQMLNAAYQKAVEAGARIFFVKQDICDFKLLRSADAITCYLDSINHILEPSKLKRLFKRSWDYLNPGGLFLFDVNTRYKFEHVYSNNIYTEDFEDLVYIWRNKYDKKSRIVEFDLVFFERLKNSLYSRFEDINYERYYTPEQLDGFIESSGFEKIGVFDDFSYKAPARKCVRNLYILKKPLY